MGAIQKGSQWPDLGKFEQENKVILNYDPKYKITIHRVRSDINKWLSKLTSMDKSPVKNSE